MKYGARRLVVIFGPSGVGKTSLVEAALHNESCARARRVVTTTSRAPRVGEIQGQHYNFIDEVVFTRLISEGAFVEWSRAYGAYYGILRRSLEEVWARQELPVVLLDRAGVVAVKREYPSAVAVFLIPPSLSELEVRLRSRQTESEEAIMRRLALAKDELIKEKEAPLADYTLLNDVFAISVQEIVKIICKN